MKLGQFKALTFDCYGTLIDWETGMVEALKPLTSRVTPALARNQILEAHARHESAQQLWTPARRYSELLAVVYKRLAEEWSVPASWEECETYGRSVGNWPAFPDSAEALQYLKQHYKLVILSNVDNASFALSNKRLQVTFDAILTAEDIGSYKPDDRNFRYMLEKLGGMGIGKEQILHTAASLFHDHEPANRAGLTSCWIDRRHGDAGFGATMAPVSHAEVSGPFHQHDRAGESASGGARPGLAKQLRSGLAIGSASVGYRSIRTGRYLGGWHHRPLNWIGLMSQLRWIAGWHVSRTAMFDLSSGRWLRRRIGRVAGKTKKQNGKRQGRINAIHGHSPRRWPPRQ